MKQITHILAIDDDEQIRNLLSDYFQNQEYQVTTAVNGSEGMQILEKESIQIVILDVLMPPPGGMELLAKIHKDHPNLPVILLTGIGYDEALILEAKANGATGFVSKGMPISQLSLEIKHALKRSLQASL